MQVGGGADGEGEGQTASVWTPETMTWAEGSREGRRLSDWATQVPPFLIHLWERGRENPMSFDLSIYI